MSNNLISQKVYRLNINDKSLLTPAETAKLLHLASTTIRHWAQIGHLPFIATLGGHRRFNKKDILALMSPSKTNIKNVFSILIIEDDKNFADMLTQFLKMIFPNINIKTAYNPFDAGNLLNTFKPDLVILDLMMMTINGFSIFHRIKSSSATASISVIAMTGVSTEENKKKIVKLGADICLGTPINFSLLERNTLQFIKQKKLVL